MRKLFSLITALVLCTAMWGGEPKVSQTLYKVEGALYQGLNEKFTGGQNIFVPNDSAVVFTSFDGQPADWYRNNELQEGGEGTPSFKFQKSFNDYAPIQIRNYTGYGQNAIKTKIDYIYGKAAYNGKTLVVGASGMNMMSMANGYYFRTEDSATTGDIGKCYADNKTANTYKSNSSYGTYMMYGNDFTHSTHGAVQAYEMVLDNPGEMYIDYVVLPIFGYPKDKNTTIDMMIPDGKTVTLKLYPLSAISKNADGKYSYTKESTPIATMTADASAYTQDATSGYSYRGTLKFELDEPILMTKSFVARLTWDDGCNFGLITDYYNLQNYTTWYIFKDGKYYLWTGGGYNSSISYHATFPTLDKKDTKTAFNFASTGGSDNIAFRSNIDPAKTEDFTIDFGGAEWISMTGITYSEGTYKKSGTNTLTFAVEANEGEAREATITLKHHGKVLTYTVKQEAAPAPVEPTNLYLKAGEVDYMKDGAVVYLYSWGGSSEADWSKFELIQNETTAKASMMKDRIGMKIVRFASGTTTPSWQGTIWNQTGDISVSSDFPEKVDMVELPDWAGATSATWSKYVKPEPAKYYLVGNFCGWDVKKSVLFEKNAKDTLEVTIESIKDSIKVICGQAWDKNYGAWNAPYTLSLGAEYGMLSNSEGDPKNFVLSQPYTDATFQLYEGKDGKLYIKFVSGTPVELPKKSFTYIAGESKNDGASFFVIGWGKEAASATTRLEATLLEKDTVSYDGKVLEGVDSLVLVRCAKGAKEIIWDGEGKNVWNQSANVAFADTLYFIGYDEGGAILLDTVPAKPVEVKYFAKNNWNGTAEWSWLELVPSTVDNVYMLDTVVFGGTGVNVNDKADDAGAIFIAANKIVVLNGLDGIPTPYIPEPRKHDTVLYAPARTSGVLEAPTLLAGDTIKLFFDAADSTLSAFIIGRPAPAPRKEFTFIAGEVAEADPTLFAITWGKDGSNETVKLANKEADIYTAEILETVDSLVLVRCASDAAEIIWDGEGKNVWNQTDNYAICDTMYFKAWVDGSNKFIITCDAPKPVEVKYYLKNNWNGAAEWSWKEMTKKEDAYVLDSVIFGGTGVNLNTKEDDADAVWFDLDKLTYNEKDTIQALDTVRFELTISEKDTILKAIIVGRPAPAPRKEFVFVAGEVAESNPTLFAITWGKDGSNETVKLANKEADIYTAEILETIDSLVLVRCASDAAEIIWEGEGKNVWNQTDNYAICDTMYFESWVDGSNLFTITCETPKPVCEPGYAIVVNGERKMLSLNADQKDYTEYWIDSLALEVDDQIVLLDTCADVTFKVAVKGYEGLKPVGESDTLQVTEAAYYQFYLKLIYGGDELYVVKLEEPQPAEEGFGVIFSDGKTIKGTKNEGQTEYLEYIIEANLTASTTFQLYDFANKASWTESEIDEASTSFLRINDDNVYEVTADGKYTIYLKMYGLGNNQVYCTYDGSATNLNNLKALDGKRYNILGLPVDASYHGIVIIDGQTYLQ